MESILYVGLDVHKETYSISTYVAGEDKIISQQTIKAEFKLVLKYIDTLRFRYGKNANIVCGYEAGPLGYTLYHQFNDHGIKCVILAPTTMAQTNKNRVKTDKIDSEIIAKCLAFNTYSPVYVPDATDQEVRDFIRMRDARVQALKVVKQQILSFVLNHGHKYGGGKKYWTKTHIKWLRDIEFSGVTKETFLEMLAEFDHLTGKVERLNLRIEELSQTDRYQEKVAMIKCFHGCQTYTALTLIVETGDFNRFATADQYAAFLGLTPSEHSSGATTRKGGITKTGNTNIRKTLVEASHSFARGQIGHISKELNKRQQGNPPDVIAYANKANERLRRKAYRLMLKNNKHRNQAVTAVARELACFVWGMMTGNIA